MLRTSVTDMVYNPPDLLTSPNWRSQEVRKHGREGQSTAKAAHPSVLKILLLITQWVPYVPWKCNMWEDFQSINILGQIKAIYYPTQLLNLVVLQQVFSDIFELGWTMPQRKVTGQLS